MRAKVLEITDQSVYLEIDQQIRFRSAYRLRDARRRLAPLDCVDIAFDPRKPDGPVIIKQVVTKTRPTVNL